MGGERLNEFEKLNMSGIDNFFILEYVKRKLLVDEKQRKTIFCWKETYKKVTEILSQEFFIDSLNDYTFHCIVEHFKVKQDISEAVFVDMFNHLPQSYLNNETIQSTIRKLNDAIDKVVISDNDINEAEKYYNLLLLIRDNDIASRIEAWDHFLSFQKKPIITDENGKKVYMAGASVGKNVGLYKFEAGKKNEFEQYISIDDHYLSAPNPKNLKLINTTSKVNIYDSNQNNIVIDGCSLGSSTIFVVDSRCVMDAIDILKKEINGLRTNNIYIKRFDAVLPRLLGLYIWDKVKISGSTIAKAVDDVHNKKELKISNQYSTDQLNSIYRQAAKNIDNVFGELTKSQSMK
jgi:hypothetical protein